MADQNIVQDETLVRFEAVKDGIVRDYLIEYKETLQEFDQKVDDILHRMSDRAEQKRKSNS